MKTKEATKKVWRNAAFQNWVKDIVTKAEIRGRKAPTIESNKIV
jgi:hypothetical protein